MMARIWNSLQKCYELLWVPWTSLSGRWMECWVFSICPSKSILCPSSHCFVSQDADLHGFHQPGLLALWPPGKFGQVQAPAGGQRTEERVWSVYSPVSSVLGYSSVVAEFVYLWSKTASGKPTGIVTVLTWFSYQLPSLSLSGLGAATASCCYQHWVFDRLLLFTLTLSTLPALCKSSLHFF